MAFFNYEMTFEEEPAQLRVTVTGSYSARRSKHAWARLAREAGRRGAGKVLIDARGVAGGPSAQQQFEEGEYVATHVRFKFALLRPPDRSEEFGEWVALRGGARGRIFVQEAEATDWLLKD